MQGGRLLIRLGDSDIDYDKNFRFDFIIVDTCKYSTAQGNYSATTMGKTLTLHEVGDI